MMDFKDIGTEACPLRASGADSLLWCPLFYLGRSFELVEDTVGAPAHTGTAVARVIELWHGGALLADALAQVHVEAFTGGRPFPLADFEAVEVMSFAYIEDPRNAPGQVLACETQAEGYVLPGLYVSGRYDQIRRHGEERRVWDLKAEQVPLKTESHLAQLACYAELNECGVGGLIALRDYMRKKGEGPVFVGVDFPRPSRIALLEAVRFEVKTLRSGVVNARPGQHCRFCQWGGFEQCLAMLGRKHRG